MLSERDDSEGVKHTLSTSPLCYIVRSIFPELEAYIERFLLK